MSRHWSESDIETFSIRYNKNEREANGVILSLDDYNAILVEIEGLKDEIGTLADEIKKLESENRDLELEIESLNDSLQDALDENLRLAANG